MASGFVGIKEANRALKRLPEFAREDVQPVMDVTAFNIARNAQARVNRRTGFLANRIRWTSRPRSMSAVVGVAPEAYYWKFLEYGTVRMDAAPFMRPAAEAEQSTHGAAMVRALEKANARMERSAGSVTSGLL